MPEQNRFCPFDNDTETQNHDCNSRCALWRSIDQRTVPPSGECAFQTIARSVNAHVNAVIRLIGSQEELQAKLNETARGVGMFHTHELKRFNEDREKMEGEIKFPEGGLMRTMEPREKRDG